MTRKGPPPPPWESPGHKAPPPQTKKPPKYPHRRRVFGRAFPKGFAHSSALALASLRLAVAKIGTSLVGGDQSGAGGGRGLYTLDLQLERTSPSQITSGDKSIALGNECSASALGAVAIGLAANTSGIDGVSIGNAANAGSDDSLALGTQAFTLGLQANALGYFSAARIDKTTNISGPIIGGLNSSQAGADWFQQCAAAEIILRTRWLDPSSIADYTMALPAGCRFWIDEIGIMVSSFTGVVAQPFVHFGNLTLPQKNLANVQTANLTALGKRQAWTPLASTDGETGLLFGISTASTGAGMRIAPYWRGILLES